jgi:hypothetical protein
MHCSSNLCIGAASGDGADGRLLPTLQIDVGCGQRQLRNGRVLDCSHVPSAADGDSGQGDLLAIFRADEDQAMRTHDGCARGTVGDETLARASAMLQGPQEANEAWLWTNGRTDKSRRGLVRSGTMCDAQADVGVEW